MAFFNITKITIPQTFAIPRNLLVNFVNFSHKWGYFIITKIMLVFFDIPLTFNKVD